MGEDTLATLRVINGTTREISANRNPNNAGRRKSVIRTPANQRQLIPQLHHGRPDVIEKLNLYHWLQSARSHANRASDDVGLRQRRIENPIAAKIILQTVGQFEHTAFAFDQLLRQILLPAAIGHVFAENYNALIPPHLVTQRGIDKIGHGFRSHLLTVHSGSNGCRFALQRRRSRIEVRRINIL